MLVATAVVHHTISMLFFLCAVHVVGYETLKLLQSTPLDIAPQCKIVQRCDTSKVWYTEGVKQKCFIRPRP